MKRCQQCNFVYEDDQQHCDLDGSQLDHDSGLLPPPVLTAPPLADPPVTSRRGGFTLLSVAGLTLAAVLPLIYYTLPDRAVASRSAQPSVKQAAHAQPEPKMVLAPPHTDDTPSPAPLPSASGVRVSRRVPLQPKRSLVSPHPPLPKPEEKTAEPEAESPKKESKRGSILKRAGRVLKKPFGF